jgi:D-alanyl-D-alanine carboxypeptidase
MIASNNEASEQMARYIGNGDLRAFIDRMNKRALELGMNSTFYSNPTGLPASVHSLDNSSTPIDLLTLALEMVKYPEILEVTGMGYADVQQNGRYTQQLRNHNRLAIEYNGEVDGMKTGYTRRAGFCLVATSNKCDYRLISVALGSNAPGTRNDIVKGLINEYYTSVGIDRLGPYGHAPADLYASSFPAPADSNADFIYKSKLVRQNHTVRRGEHLAVIADKYNCSVTDLKRWNKMRTSRLIPGQKLKIYASVQEKIYVRNPVVPDAIASDEQEPSEEQPSAPAVADASREPVPSGEASKYVIYTVQPGDTLFNISKRYEGSTVQQLKKINKINNIRSIKVGTRLKVPVNS